MAPPPTFCDNFLTFIFLNVYDEFCDDVIFVMTRFPPDRFSIRQLLTISGVTLVRTLPMAPLILPYDELAWRLPVAVVNWKNWGGAP